MILSKHHWATVLVLVLPKVENLLPLAVVTCKDSVVQLQTLLTPFFKHKLCLLHYNTSLGTSWESLTVYGIPQTLTV